MWYYNNNNLFIFKTFESLLVWYFNYFRFLSFCNNNRDKVSSLIKCIILLFSGPVRNSNTLTTHLTLSRYQREIIDGNGTATDEETCIFNDGQTVLKADVNCDKRPGCKTIQKPNECCPEYQCGKAINQKKPNTLFNSFFLIIS